MRLYLPCRRSLLASAVTSSLFWAVLLLVVSVLNTPSVSARNYLVSNKKDFISRVNKLDPGDTLVMENGIWYDFDILFKAVGTEKKPITLRAQEKGKVILSGQSSLRISGEHLIVRGLVFKNGYTVRDSVISFRQDTKNLAYHSRVTQVVIDNYNNLERFENDSWVLMYGRHNRFDHNHLVGKRNRGPTLAVKLNSNESHKNYHKIDYNYFGLRPILGSDDAETIRIGSSRHSLAESHTTVENNYFDRCDGELEIISNKSSNNVFRGNVFFESRGTLTISHGHNTLVENNVFWGGNKDSTGGIRVLGKGQTVRNNYMEGLKGYGLGGALVVMNGIPESPLEGYHQVVEAVVENNSIIDANSVHWAAGSGLGRSAAPVESSFKNNLIVTGEEREKGEDNFIIEGDISGITFSDNFVHNVEDFAIEQGFTRQNIGLKRSSNGLLRAKSQKLSRTAGVDKKLKPLLKSKTGVSWYQKPSDTVESGTGKKIKVKPKSGALYAAIKKAQSGDILRLSPGEYTISNTLIIDKPLTIVAQKFNPRNQGIKTVKIHFERSTLFKIVDGGSLHLKGLYISGSMAPSVSRNAVIRTQSRAMLQNYSLHIESTTIENLDGHHSFNVIDMSKGGFADNVTITDSEFNDISGSILRLDKGSDDYDIYSVESVVISNSSFYNVQNALLNIYHSGIDESAFGPHFSMTKSKLERVGVGKRNKSKASIVLHGVQVAQIIDNTIIDSLTLLIQHTVSTPQTRIEKNRFINTMKPLVKELKSVKKRTIMQNNTFE